MRGVHAALMIADFLANLAIGHLDDDMRGIEAKGEERTGGEQS
jgi:hypothetical protein